MRVFTAAALKQSTQDIPFWVWLVMKFRPTNYIFDDEDTRVEYKQFHGITYITKIEILKK